MALTTVSVRPSKKELNKGEDYHLKMAKFFAGSANNSEHNAYVAKCILNRAFADGDQWLLSEDLDAFLLDQSGGFRNRVRFINNIIKPIIRSYVGSVIKTDYSYKVFPSSDMSLKRRQTQLNEVLIMDYASKKSAPFIRDFVSQSLPLGDTMQETKEAFKKTYKDKFITNMNFLVHHISTIANDFEALKVYSMKSLVLNGMCVLNAFHKRKEMYFDQVDTSVFLFDRSAKLPDLSDGEFMGEWFQTYPSYLFDSVKLTGGQKKALEDYVRSNQKNANAISGVAQRYFGQTQGSVPVVRMFWKDIETREYAYVNDEFGNKYYTQINYDGGRYTSSHAVDPPDYEAEYFEGKKIIKVEGEQLRWCEFIDKAIIGSELDIVLSFGVYPWQEESVRRPGGVEFTYKVATYDYSNGKINTPIDDVISPQRFINRMLSMGEAQFNNARPGGTVFSRKAIQNIEGGEAELQKKVNLGEPITINSDQVNNAIGEYRSTFGDGTVVLFNIADQVQRMAKEQNGMNEAMLGNVGGKRELRGVVESMIQRGSLMIEDVFFALGKMLQSCYQGMIEQGKFIYYGSPVIVSNIDDPIELSSFIIDDDYIKEKFRAVIKRTVSTDEMIAQTNVSITTAFQLGLIDKKRYGQLFNRSTLDDLQKAIVDYAQEEEYMQAQASEAAEQRQNAVMAQNQQTVNQQMEQADVQDKRKNLVKTLDIAMKNQNNS